LGISTIALAGGEPRRLTIEPGHAIAVIARQDQTIFQRIEEDGQQHIWRMGLDGSDPRQITSGGGERLLHVSLDGSLVAFSRSDSAKGVWVVPSTGGEATLIAPKAEPAFGGFSRDGKNIFVIELRIDASGLIQRFVRLLPVAGGREIANFLRPPEALDPQQGEADETTFLYRDDPVRNVYAASRASDTRRKITNFTNGRLTIHRWSPDMRRVAVVRHDETGANVWVVNANGGSPTQITRFDGQDIPEIAWTPDSQRVVVRAGTSSRDVVLISNFQ